MTFPLAETTFLESWVAPKNVLHQKPEVTTAFPWSFGSFLALQINAVLSLLVTIEMFASVTECNQPLPSKRLHVKSLLMLAALLSAMVNPERTITSTTARHTAVNLKKIFIINEFVVLNRNLAVLEIAKRKKLSTLFYSINYNYQSPGCKRNLQEYHKFRYLTT